MFDEEIGWGVDYVDMEKLNVDFGYIVDGECLGSLEDEIFFVDVVIVNIIGVSIYLGFVKGKLESVLKIVVDLVVALFKDCFLLEIMEGKEGFVYFVSISGGVELV